MKNCSRKDCKQQNPQPLRVLGLMKDNSYILQKATDYLRSFELVATENPKIFYICGSKP